MEEKVKQIKMRTFTSKLENKELNGNSRIEKYKTQFKTMHIFNSRVEHFKNKSVCELGNRTTKNA